MNESSDISASGMLAEMLPLAEDSGYEIVSRSGAYTPDEPIDNMSEMRDSHSLLSMSSWIDTSYAWWIGACVLFLLVLYFFIRSFWSHH